jgi:hypothetical protein
MNRIGISLASVFAVVLVAFLAFPSGPLDNKNVQIAVAVFMFVAYCVVVIAFATGKKRELPLGWQTVVGILVALIIAAIFHVSSIGYALALVLGVSLGATAHKWVSHVQFP